MDNRDIDLVRSLQAYTERLERGGELSGTEIAQALATLTDREVTPGGPYRIFKDDAVDIGLNLVIDRFLHVCDVSLPSLDSYLTNACTEGDLSSRVLSAEELRTLLYMRSVRTKETGASSSLSYDSEEESVIHTLRSCMEKRLVDLSPEVREGARYVIERTIRGNPDKQMTLMAAYLRRALGTKGAIFNDDYIGKLGFANVCFWTSFIVYDDFWDEDEAAEARLLPVANLLARTFIRTFTELLPADSGFSEYFHETMDRLDAANAWETVMCRMRREGNRVLLPEALPAYGDFSIKFYPAAGHVMGPVAMLMALGYAADSEEVSFLVEYFENYLIAMQLNDDAHDWREDLERGHISTVISILLTHWTQAHADKDEIDLSVDMPELEQIFWFKTLDEINRAVLTRTMRAREALEKLTCLEDTSPLMQFIDRNEAIAKMAMHERERSEEFLAAFRSHSLSTRF